MTESNLKFKKLLGERVGADWDYQCPQAFGIFLSYLWSASLSSHSGRPMMSATDLIVS